MISIVGSGGHSRSLIPIIIESGYKIEAVFDESFDGSPEVIYENINLNGKIDDLVEKSQVILAVGDNIKRRELAGKLNVFENNIIANSSKVDKTVKLDSSNQILNNVFVNSYVQIGSHNIVNTGAIIEHEVKIGDYNHIAIGAKLCGRVTIGNNVMIGAGAIVIDSVNICDDVIIGAGTIVNKDIVESGTYVGSPARKVK